MLHKKTKSITIYEEDTESIIDIQQLETQDSFYCSGESLMEKGLVPQKPWPVSLEKHLYISRAPEFCKCMCKMTD